MKFVFICFVTLILNQLSAQVSFTRYPQDKQLFGRNKSSGYGLARVRGYYLLDSMSYSAVSTYLYRGDSLVSTHTVEFEPGSDSTFFEFDIQIYAELSEYKLETYGVRDSSETLLQSASDLVAGDVIVIQGQSNAEAKNRGEESADYVGCEFIRVFAGGFPQDTMLLSNLNWYIGQGDGDRTTAGNCGQWGLLLARHLVDSLQIPVAIFNGGHGGTGINFFQRDEAYQSQLNSNYSRLYFRISRAELTDFVEVILWSQGEHDAATTVQTSTEAYITKFNQLYTAWSSDYPNLKKVILFQTAKGCSTLVQNMQRITEAQRIIASESEYCSLIPTHGIPFRVDSCHFRFEDGYRKFGDRAFYMLMKEVYYRDQPVNLDYPKLQRAEIAGPGIIRLSFDKNLLVLDSASTDFYLNNDPELKSYKINAYLNYLDVYFNHEVNESTLISYGGNKTIYPAFTCTEGIETARFHLFGIFDPFASEKEKINGYFIVYPNPSHGQFKLLLKHSWAESAAQVYDNLGKPVFTAALPESYNEIDLSFLDAGLYHLKIYSGETVIETRKITIDK
ncbi:MAG: sialate O-acetylesterase [Bacteroidota bacterium]